MTLLTTDAVTQYAVLDALLAGAYTSGIPATDARRLGDFGIGCCDGLAGEVILVDGDLLECTDEAAPREMADDESLPFLDVCTFPDVAAETVGDLDLAALTAAVEERLVSLNLFHAVRVDGVVATVRIRVPRRREAPFRSLADVTRDQVETVLEERTGTLVGFWAPEIYQGIAVAGLHLHFIAADRLSGGTCSRSRSRQGSCASPRIRASICVSPPTRSSCALRSPTATITASWPWRAASPTDPAFVAAGALRLVAALLAQGPVRAQRRGRSPPGR